jgi:hypothetical protein
MDTGQIKPALWGAAIAAVILIVGGSWWPGWMLKTNAENMAVERVASAVVAARADICVAQVKARPDAAVVIATIKGAQYWERGDALSKTGAATLPGMAKPDPDVAKACGELLAK